MYLYINIAHCNSVFLDNLMEFEKYRFNLNAVLIIDVVAILSCWYLARTSCYIWWAFVHYQWIVCKYVSTMPIAAHDVMNG